jgi:hypothetical protein
MRGFSAALATAVLSGMLPGSVAMADERPKPLLGELKQPRAVAVTRVASGSEKKPDAATEHPWRRPKASWPAAGSAEVELDSGMLSKGFLSGPARSPAAGSGPRQAGALPVAVSAAPGAAAAAPAKVKVSVSTRDASRKAGVDGLLLSVSSVHREVAGHGVSAAGEP